MSRQVEGAISGWMKVLIPVMVATCLTLSGALWHQSSTVTAIKTTLDQRTQVIKDFKAEDKELRDEIKELRSELNSMRSDVSMHSSTQGKVLEVVDRLSITLSRLEVAMGKLETKLEYRLNEG